MIDYTIRIGLGHSASTFVGFPVEPYYEGLEYPREVFSATDVFDDGLPLARLRFLALEQGDFVISMTRAGVYTAKTALVSIQLPDDAVGSSYTTYNGQAVKPFVGRDRSRDQLRYHNVELLVRMLT